MNAQEKARFLAIVEKLIARGLNKREVVGAFWRRFTIKVSLTNGRLCLNAVNSKAFTAGIDEIERHFDAFLNTRGKHAGYCRREREKTEPKIPRMGELEIPWVTKKGYQRSGIRRRFHEKDTDIWPIKSQPISTATGLSDDAFNGRIKIAVIVTALLMFFGGAGFSFYCKAQAEEADDSGSHKMESATVKNAAHPEEYLLDESRRAELENEAQKYYDEAKSYEGAKWVAYYLAGCGAGILCVFLAVSWLANPTFSLEAAKGLYMGQSLNNQMQIRRDVSEIRKLYRD